MKVVDLFCGIGGLSYGLKEAGLDVVAGIDIDPSCQYAFESNCGAPFITQDVNRLDPTKLKSLYGKTDTKILVGCAPCQPFSNYTQSADKRSDHRWQLLNRFSDLIEAVEPEIVSMENVPQMVKFKDAPVLDRFVRRLKRADYEVSHCVVNSADYGVPQMRKRFILLASRLGPIQLIPPTHTKTQYVTVKQTIGRMPQINHGECDPHDFFHRATRLNDINLRRVKASLPGGSWVRDWPDELIPQCYKGASRRSYSSIYGRMRWNELAPTITTHCTGTGNGRFSHPEQDRAISLREASMLQSFPKNYRFAPSPEAMNIRNLARHIGNAVPPGLGRAIGKSIVNHLS